jgi:hypothetical protein
VKTVLAGLSVLTVLLVGGSSVAATSFPVRRIAETQSSITLGWDKQPGDGYRFYKDGVVVSRTFDPARTSVKFSKGQSYKVEVQLIQYGNSGVYPSAPVNVSGKANIWVSR